VIAVVTKTDAAERSEVAAQLLALSGLGAWAEVVPVSAVAGEQVDLLTDLLIARLPKGRRSTSTASSPTSPRW